MTDYADLIARLRDKSKISSALEDEAASALEAQARRIEHLHNDMKFMDGKNDDLRALLENDRDTIDELRARIAELEAAFEQAANDMLPMLRSMISRGEAAEIVRRAARAAFLGEKE